MKLIVGFITYNEATAKYLGDFLPSLERALNFLDNSSYRIYAYDNSDEGNKSNDRLLSQYKQIKRFGRNENLGFARAYNLMIAAAAREESEYFLVVNPDTLIEPEAVKLLIRALDGNKLLGSAAPKILRWDFANRQKTLIVDSFGLVLGRGLQFKDLGQGRKDKTVSDISKLKIIGPSGAAGLYRLSALQKVAENRAGSGAMEYFDERFFMYKEDCDLAYRLSLAGFGSIIVPEAIIYHDRTASVSGRGWRSFWRDRRAKSSQIRAWSMRNQHFIFIKFWQKQSFIDKIIISLRVLTSLIFSLVLEQFLLKEYKSIIRFAMGLTNTK